MERSTLRERRFQKLSMAIPELLDLAWHRAAQDRIEPSLEALEILGSAERDVFRDPVHLASSDWFLPARITT
jgi:hypothetical protein